MKRIIPFLIVCAFLSILGGCDLMMYIRQHVVGHGYNQVSMDAIQGAETNMSSAAVAGGSLGLNSVLVYKTRNGYYGKLSVLSAAGQGLEIQYTTWDAFGQVLAARERLAMAAGSFCDLESTAAAVSPAQGSLLWTGAALVPQGSPPAKLYLLP
jgi:hypothetical protein